MSFSETSKKKEKSDKQVDEKNETIPGFLIDNDNSNSENIKTITKERKDPKSFNKTDLSFSETNEKTSLCNKTVSLNEDSKLKY